MKAGLAVVVLSAAALLVACGDAERATADAAVRAFHNEFNAGAYESTYASASAEFRTALPQADWTSLLQAVRRKAGMFESAQQTSWLLSSGTTGTTISLTYLSKFERLKATEKFVWRIQGAKALLVNYRIDSPDLIKD